MPGAPRFEGTGRDRRLGEVIDDEPDIRQAPGKLHGRRQLARSQEEVVGETGRSDGPDPADHVRAQEPRRVRLVVNLVTDPDQAIAAGPGSQRWRWRPPRPDRSGPPSRSTPRTKGVAAARARNSAVSSRLDRVWTRTVASTPRRCELRREIVRPERPTDRRRAHRSTTDSPPFAGSQKWWWASTITAGQSGTGASAARSPSRAELGPQVGRDRVREHRGVLVEVGGRPNAGDEGHDGRMRERELHRRRPERHTVAGADRRRDGGPAR